MKVTRVIACLLAGTAACAAHAQGASSTVPDQAADQAAGAKTGGLEDIVVTATRREERLQNVPVTITALTGSTLQTAGLTDIRNLTQVIPSFFGGKNLGLFLPVIRGVGSSSTAAADEANVATYIDGVYQPDPFSTYIELAEVERVEVLRGPQGTVFGRNATGGLINVITPDPKFKATGHFSAKYGRLRGDASDIDIRGYVTGPLSDNVAMDLAGVYRKTDGYIDDLVRGGKLGGSEVFNIRSKLLVRPTDNSEFVLTGEIADQKSQTNALQPLNGNTAGIRFPGVILPTQPWQASVDSIPRLDFRRYNVAFRGKVELGDVNLETTTGYMKVTTHQNTDSDSSNIALGIVAGDPINTWSLSQEVRLLSAGSGPFTWLLGFYAFRLEADAEIRIFSAPNGPTGASTNTVFRPGLGTTSYAGFGEGTYNLTDGLFLTLGARYTWEKREFSQNLNGAQLFSDATKTFDKITYRAALRYEFADNANIYASYGTGYKSGVYNYTSTTPTPVDPETISAVEVGIKADPLSWLRTNASIYHYDYKNLQLISRAPTGNNFLLQNAATAEIYGGELEVTAAVSRDLNLRGSFAYTHARYNDFPLAQTYVPQANGGNASVTANVSGNAMTRAPETSFNLGFDWGHDLGGGRFRVAGNLYHSSRVFFDFAERFSQDPYTLLNGEVAWTTPDEAWKFSVWATNLTNVTVFREIRNGPLTTDVTYETPRRVGVGVSYKF